MKSEKIPITRRNGFTLLELMVTISILGMLMLFVTGNYFNSQKRARDAKRKGDVKTIQNSLEQYYATCGFVYPTPNTNGSFTDIVCTSPSIAIMQTPPTDPLTESAYGCSACDSASYTICPTLEVEPTGYCLTNLQ